MDNFTHISNYQSFFTEGQVRLAQDRKKYALLNGEILHSEFNVVKSFAYGHDGILSYLDPNKNGLGRNF